MIVSNATAMALQALYDYFFNLNSYFDNQYGWLDFHDFVKTQHYWHETLAHFWVGDNGADDLGGYMIELGIRPVRGKNPENAYDYENFVELFADAYDEVLKFQTAIYNAIDIADNNRDITARTFLEDYVTVVLPPILHQLMIVKNKAKELGEKPATFDEYFEDFIVWGN